MKEETLTLYKEYFGTYYNFINKYKRLLKSGRLDRGNHDLRCFISCYMKNKNNIKSIRKGMYHTTEAILEAKEIALTIGDVFRDYSDEEIFHELSIPYLEMINRYKETGVSFEKYLYKGYRYYLKRHIDKLLKSHMENKNVRYYDNFQSNEWNEVEVYIKEKEKYEITLDEDMSLNHPFWLNGKQASQPFDDLSMTERIILVKYYQDGWTDKEIGAHIGRNLKSINRIRVKIKKKFKKMYTEGHFKNIRLEE